MCIICNEPADKVSIYVPGERTRLIIGSAEDGKVTMVPFGICSSHLDADGNIPSELSAQVVQLIFNKIRQGNVPKITTEEDLDGFLDS